MKITNRLFILIIIIALTVFIISQIFLIKRNNISQNDMIAKYVFNDNVLNGNIIIKTSNPSKNVFVLENGEKTNTLEKEKLSINISHNTVVEIDGRNESKPFYVEIYKTSDNINGKYYNKIKITSNIVILGKFFVK